MADITKDYPKSIYFNLPRRQVISVGNIYTGSENTFNYRFKSDKDTGRIHLWVWYGMKCFELSELVAEHEDDDSNEGWAKLIEALDYDYDDYKARIESGEVIGRPTYDDLRYDGPILSDEEIFAQEESEDEEYDSGFDGENDSEDDSGSDEDDKPE